VTLQPGEEFKLRATPDQELLRKLAYLSAQDNDSVLTGGTSSKSGHKSTAARASRTTDALMMARLADPDYQALSARINENLDRMDEASVRALQEIEEKLAELRRERERMLEEAYRDELGRAIFMTNDGTAAYYGDGGRVAADDFTRHKPHLRDRATWDEWQESYRREGELNTERDQIHAHDAARDQLREDLAAGKISKEEAERRERELAESLPDRARSSNEAATSQEAALNPAADTALSAEEEALLNVRAEPQGPVGPAPG
jgi:hypothetical protein